MSRSRSDQVSPCFQYPRLEFTRARTSRASEVENSAIGSRRCCSPASWHRQHRALFSALAPPGPRVIPSRENSKPSDAGDPSDSTQTTTIFIDSQAIIMRIELPTVHDETRRGASRTKSNEIETFPAAEHWPIIFQSSTHGNSSKFR